MSNFLFNSIKLHPARIEINVSMMSRTQAANMLPVLCDDYNPGQVKAWVNSWAQRGFKTITVVQVCDENGDIVINHVPQDEAGRLLFRALTHLGMKSSEGTNRASITGTKELVDFREVEHAFDFFEGHPFKNEFIKSLKAQSESAI